MTRDHILDIAGDYLAEDDIRLVDDIDEGTHNEAWARAVADFGTRIALIHAPGNRYEQVTDVHWQHDQPDIARAIVAAFTAAGCETGWTGDAWAPVRVRLP